jgi:hypothetical protein
MNTKSQAGLEVPRELEASLDFIVKAFNRRGKVVQRTVRYGCMSLHMQS